MNELNIFQRLLKITEELNTVAKNLEVGTGRSSYKAVGEADILSAVKPLEAQYGVYSYPLDRELVSQELIQGEKKGYKDTDPPIQTLKFFMRLKTTYRFVNIDKPSEFVDQVSYGDGVDTLDKSPGKAMTYSDKYSLMKAYKIMTGDDPDQNHSNDTTVKKYNTGSVGTQHAKITEFQKDQIIKLAQSNNIDITKVIAYYKVKSTDELNFQQANAVITQGNKKKVAT